MIVSIVMPNLNEVKTLTACIEKAQEALDKLEVPGEIVIADNGSTDGSQQLALSLGARVINVPLKGYGVALIRGIQEAKGEYVVIGDADDSYDFREAVPMVDQLFKGYDLCMGTRLQGHIMPGAMPWKNRYVGTPILTAILNLLYKSSFSDVNCGMRAFTKEAFLSLRMESRGMEFASEMLVKASVLGLKMTEIPITLHKDGRDRKPHLRPWEDGWRHLKYILLFAPKFTFWLPGLILLALGTILGIALNMTQGGKFLYIGNFRFNDHWMVVAVLLCLVGYQIIVTGFLAYLYTLIHRLQRRTFNVDRLTRIFNIERIIIFALLIFTAGMALELSVVNAWISGDFGPLNAIRPALAGMALILISTQTLFSGFFYAVLVEQYEKPVFLEY